MFGCSAGMLRLVLPTLPPSMLLRERSVAYQSISVFATWVGEVGSLAV